MPPAVLDRSALDSLFSRAPYRPSDGDWDRVARDTAQHLIEHPKTGMLMVLVPAGQFLSNTVGRPEKVDLPAYYVAVHPVTNAQYARFAAETAHSHTHKHVWHKSCHPVTNVDWEDATAYCCWAGLRLPTALEWEKAARGLDGRAYPWGEAWDPNRCRHSGNKGSETTAGVWRYGPGGSPFGALQFSGNVWELCADWHDANTYARYPSSVSSPVVRGGSWELDFPDYFSTSFRVSLSDPRFANFGFRCVSGLGASP